MINYAGKTNTLPSGKQVGFEFWEYIAIPIGFGDGTQVPFESYEEEEVVCEECRKRDICCETLEVIINTGLTQKQLKDITF